MIQILFLDLDTIGILTIITKLIAQFLPSMKTVTIDNKICLLWARKWKRSQREILITIDRHFADVNCK